MRKKLILNVAVLAYSLMQSFGQNNINNQIITTDAICISYDKIIDVSLCDTSMINLIADFVANMKNQDSIFPSTGYVKLVFKNRFQNTNTQFRKCFFLSVNYYYFNEKDSSNKFPLFYTKISDKFVLIYDDAIVNEGLAKKNKKRFAKMINKVLPKQKFLEFSNENGKKIILSPVGRIAIDSEKMFCY